MSTSQGGPGSSSKTLVGLSNLREALTVLANVADGGINVPFVKGSAQIAIQIIDAAQKMKNNKDDCLTVAKMAADGMLALAKPLRGKREEDVHPDLKRQIEEFGSKLKAICDSMNIMASRASIKRFLRRTTDSSDIQGWKEYLSEAHRLFMAESQITMQIAQTEGFNRVTFGLSQLSECGPQHAAKDNVAGDNIFLSRIPPPKPVIFHGRDDLFTDATNLILAHEPARLAILGTGGMGKTSLALSILHHPHVKDHFGDQCYFVPCDSAISPQQLMTCILTVLEVPRVQNEDVHTSLHKFLTRASALLLVLDNFEIPYYSEGNLTAVVDILKRIADMPKVTLMITMRGDVAPDDVLWNKIILSPLSLQACRKIFSHINPNVLESPELDILLREVDCMPLAVTLLSNLAKSKPNTCKNLLKHWSQVKTRLLRTQLGKGGRLTNAEVSIEMSLKFGPVAQVDEAIPLLALISYLPNGVYEWSDRLNQIAPGFQCLGDALEALTRAGLVQDQNDCLKVLSPIRHYVLYEHPLSDQHLKELEEYYIGIISQYNETKYSKINDLLNVETGNIISVIKSGCEHNIYSKLVKAASDMSWYLYRNSPTTELLDLIMPKLDMFNIGKSQADCHYLAGLIFETQNNYENAEQRFRQAEYQFKNDGAISKLAFCIHRRGEILRMQDRNSEAKKVLEEALSEFTKIKDHSGAAECLRSLGDILYVQNKYTEAQAKLQQALHQFTEIGGRLGAAQCLRSLGDILYTQNKYTEAQAKFQLALHQFTEIGDHLGAAQCLRSLGDILYTQNKYTEAQAKFQLALHQFTEIGDRLGAAECLKSLGDILYMQNEYTEAQAKLQQALHQFTEIGSRSGAAECLKSLGHILYTQDEYTEAQAKLQQALHQFTEIGSRSGAAECLKSLGDILYMQNEYIEAQAKLQQALHQFTQIGSCSGAARCLRTLGDILYMQNEYTEAQAKLQQALHQFTEIGDRRGAAECLRSLGDVLYMQDEYTEAQAKLQQALHQFTEIGDRRGAAECLRSLGDILYTQNEYTEAQAKLQQALHQFTEIGGRYGAAQCLLSLGNILYTQNEYTEAQAKLQQALHQFTEIGDRLGAAECLKSLGDILYTQNEYIEAQAKLQQALHQFTQIGSRSGAARCLRTLGDILYMQNEYTQAQAKLQQALHQFTEIGDRRGAAQCLQSLSDILHYKS